MVLDMMLCNVGNGQRFRFPASEKIYQVLNNEVYFPNGEVEYYDIYTRQTFITENVYQPVKFIYDAN